MTQFGKSDEKRPKNLTSADGNNSVTDKPDGQNSVDKKAYLLNDTGLLTTKLSGPSTSKTISNTGKKGPIVLAV